MNEELKKELKEIKESIKILNTNIQNMTVLNTSFMQEYSNDIITRLDLFQNLEKSNNNNTEKKIKTITKQSYFKKLLLEDKNFTLKNVLYSEEQYKLAEENKDIKNKKEGIEKRNKISAILYKEIKEKSNPYHNVLNKKYEEYKENELNKFNIEQQKNNKKEQEYNEDNEENEESKE